MDQVNLTVSLSPKEAGDIIAKAIVEENTTGTLIDHYIRNCGEQQVVVIVLEKYFLRTSNRASMTVTIDNLDGSTIVHAVASGSSQGAFSRFDWGAGNSFVNSIRQSLLRYIR